LSASEILKSMPTDEDIDFLYDQYAPVPNKGNKPVEWGDGLVWRELHHSTPYPYSAD
ncbi:MAG: IS256 family transposase, partial [Raoultibacter sp.]